MKISLKWLKDYVRSNLDVNKISEGLTSLGLECNIVSSNLSFTNIVLGKVLNVIKHPDSNHLKICTVDIGKKESLQIICGANNVESDMFVPTAKVDSTLNNGEFKIKKTKLRGVESFGMICSEKELNISDNHDGIMDIRKKSKFKLGDPIEDVLSLSIDTIFEIDLTPNRGDCFSHLGVARELAILIDGKCNNRKINLVESSKENIDDYIAITNKSSESCYRYACRLVKNVTIGESPIWLKERLNSIDQKNINNIVDAGNFIMHDYGHPMHTFDYNKISKKEIIIRDAKLGEKVRTLDGQDRILNDNQLLICDPNKTIALAGIMGCENSEITSKTKDVLIECAYFNPIKIRKGSKKIDLSTESSKRFERDTDIDNMMNALDNLASLIAELGGGEVVKGIIDSYDKIKDNKIVSFDLDRCNKFLGTKLSKKEVNNIFKMLNFKYKNSSLVIPSYRNDIEREVDLYEEIARVFGYDRIPSALTFHNSYSTIKQDDQSINDRIKNILHSKGFYEHYSNSLYNSSVLSDFNNNKTSEIINESSKDMKYLRNSLLPGLLNAVSFNEKRGQNCFKLFEIGRVHSLIKAYNKEEDNIGLIWYGKNIDHWKNKFEMDIYYAKGELLSLLSQLKVNKVNFKIEKSDFDDLNINIYSKKTCIGFLRYLNSDLKNKYDINGSIIIAEIFIDKLSKNFIKDFYYKKISLFPSVRRDVSLLLEKKINSEDVLNFIYDCSDYLLKDASIFDVYIGKELRKESKSLAIALIFQSDEKTLVDKEVDDRLTAILDKVKVKFGAVQR